MPRTIRHTAAAAASTLRAEAPRARSRTLVAEDIEDAIRAHLRIARRIARTEPTSIVVTRLCGGFVSNSYRYAATTDVVEITGTRAASIEVEGWREGAQSRSCGRGDELIIRVRKPGQVRGRIVHSA
jgi:hypothetical protein